MFYEIEFKVSRVYKVVINNLIEPILVMADSYSEAFEISKKIILSLDPSDSEEYSIISIILVAPIYF